MGDGTKENPYTREDVLKLIRRNGGTAKGLDLSGKTFEEGIDLRGLSLNGIILKKANLRLAHLEEASLTGAHLEEADLIDAHLENANLSLSHLEEAGLTGAYLKKADLRDAHLEKTHFTLAHLEQAHLTGAHLEEANLIHAHLERAQLSGAHLERACLSLAHLKGADLSFANLENADLMLADFSVDTNLTYVNWGSYILGEEKDKRFNAAADTYRRLKTWYTNAGVYDIAGEFFFREMTAKRKRLKWWPRPWNIALSKLLSILCGYGERPSRVVISAIVVVFGLAVIYRFGGLSLPYSIYYSAVSFTALGYGSWVPEPIGWVKGLGAFEAFTGVFMMALFLITFVRKMTR